MFARWPIRRKLIVAIALLLCSVAVLAFSGFNGVYAYRGLARNLSRRAEERPLATKLASLANELRSSLKSETLASHSMVDHHSGLRLFAETQFAIGVDNFGMALEAYKSLIQRNQMADAHLGDNHLEWEPELEIVKRCEATLREISDITSKSHLIDMYAVDELITLVDKLNEWVTDLPSFLNARMASVSDEVRGKYRTWIVLSWFSSALAMLMLALLGHLSYKWILRPMRELMRGSRRVAAGEFEHVIRLDSQDEMADLANAMNAMTRRFREIRDDLDEQVRQRTRQVVRNEQLASVGFLAAGVAHEINNPLASIAMCSESLEDRLSDIITQDDAESDEQHNQEISILKSYLRMIQDEAFRCKEITERLLDFSRIGDVQHQNCDLKELVEGVIEMVQQLSKYRDKAINFSAPSSVFAPVNAQEIKQVVLNLITNGLESIEPHDSIDIELDQDLDHAVLLFTDHGCGMSPDVLQHIFEPFFTRRRDGKGTGLGLSISSRIVAEHGGTIDAHSDGLGRGSRFRVTLPLRISESEDEHREQAA